MKISYFSVVTVLICAATLSAHAAVPQVPAAQPYPWLEDNYMATAGVKAKERGKRKLASSVAVESMMSKELIKFRDRWLAVKKAEEIDGLIAELETNYEQYPTDLKYLAARLIPFKHLKSIVWRLKPVVEKQKIAHSMLLTLVQGVAARIRIYFPTDQWEAGFAYVAEPFENSEKQFENVDDFQYALGTSLYRTLLQSAKRIEGLDLSGSPVVFDNKMAYGTASFQDDLDRFVTINEAERHAVLANMHEGMASLAIFVAYDRMEALEFAKDRGQLYGIDAVFWDVEGAPEASRVKLLRKSKFNKLFTLTPYGKQWMGVAFKHVKHAVRKHRLVWEELRTRTPDEFAILNPARVLPWSREIEHHLNTVEAMLRGETEVRSRFTGEVIRVNLPNYFLKPAADLKALAATRFDESPDTLKKGKIKYRNYFRGRGIEWDMAAYKDFLPSLKSGVEVAQHVRILRQSWGTLLARFPLARFVE